MKITRNNINYIFIAEDSYQQQAVIDGEAALLDILGEIIMKINHAIDNACIIIMKFHIYPYYL